MNKLKEAALVDAVQWNPPTDSYDLCCKTKGAFDQQLMTKRLSDDAVTKCLNYIMLKNSHEMCIVLLKRRNN